jgi:hypothetical protein
MMRMVLQESVLLNWGIRNLLFIKAQSLPSSMSLTGIDMDAP